MATASDPGLLTGFMKLKKSEALAVQYLSTIEAGLLLGKWSSVRTAALALAALADNRAIREGDRH
jgi:hypothetical protein